MTPEQVVEMFLVTDIFPNVDQRVAEMQRRVALTEDRQLSSTPGNLADYATDEVKNAMAEYKTRIKGTFQFYVKKHDHNGVKLFLDAFAEIVKDHSLMPLLTKADVRMIYVTALKLKKDAAPESPVMSPRARATKKVNTKPLDHVVTDPDDGLTMGQFIAALKYLAERIYGDKLYIEKYPTAASRMKKLLSKMYLLSRPSAY